MSSGLCDLHIGERYDADLVSCMVLPTIQWEDVSVCLVDTLGRTSGEGLGSKLEAFLKVFECLFEGLTVFWKPLDAFLKACKTFLTAFKGNFQRLYKVFLKAFNGLF